MTTTKKLSDTELGDVFYPVTHPWEVWERRRSSDYPFMLIGSECDYERAAVGTGLDEQEVVVLHNTRSHVSETLAE